MDNMQKKTIKVIITKQSGSEHSVKCNDYSEAFELAECLAKCVSIFHISKIEVVDEFVFSGKTNKTNIELNRSL